MTVEPGQIEDTREVKGSGAMTIIPASLKGWWKIVLVAATSVFVGGALALVPAPLSPPQAGFDPYSTYGGLSMPGRIQNLVATDAYLAVHLVLGPKIEEIRVSAEPDLRQLWTKSFIHVQDKIVLVTGRIGFVAAETEPTSGSIGLHIFDTATGNRVSYSRLDIIDHIGRFIVGRESIVDMYNGSVIYGSTQTRRIEVKAVIGDRALCLVSESPNWSARRPVLYSPASNSDAWSGRTFATEVVDFLANRLPMPADIHLDGFPALLAERGTTKSGRPFQFLLLKENGESIFLDRAFFGLLDAEPFATVDFAQTWLSPAGRILVAGINTRHLSPRDGEKMLVCVFNASGAKLAQAEINLKDNAVAWTGLEGQTLFVLLNQYRPRGQCLIASYSLPGLSRTDAVCPNADWASDPQTNRPPALIGSDFFLWTSIRKYPRNAPAPPRAKLWVPAVLGLNPRTAQGRDIYLFDDSRWKLMDFLKERGRHVFNTSHLFFPFASAANFPEGCLILPIPRSVSGWLDASLDVPQPVYVDSDVAVSYSPGGASLTVDQGRLDGANWHTPSQPTTAMFTVSFGSVSQTFPVQIIARPVNKPPVPSFILEDKLPLTPWATEASFDARASSDPDGSIVSYAWKFGDGSPETTGTDCSARHFYRNPGRYEITLTVKDDKGASGQTRKTIVVGSILNIGGTEYGLASATSSYDYVGYDVEITTGNVQDAGTNAKVSLMLYSYKRANGERDASGEITFSNYENQAYRDSFKPGHTDVFKTHIGELDDLGVFTNLDDVEYLALRHDNSGGNPSWYVQSVKIRNQKTGKEWYFQPDCWLDTAQPPLRSVMGLFRQAGAEYLRGILFGGTRKYWDMTEVCANVYILNTTSGKFHFTMLDKSMELDIFLNDIVVGRQYARGQGIATVPYIPKAEWGVEVDIASIRQPTKYKARTIKPDGTFEETFVWVFPANWKGHENAAKVAALLYSLKGSTSVFNYGDTVRQFMKDQAKWENYLKVALDSVINYGATSMAILGAPSEIDLSGTIEERVGIHVAQGLNYALKAAGLTLAYNVVSETIDIFKSMITAREWASQLRSVTAAGAAAAGGLYLLGQMADCDENLAQVDQMLDIIKDKTDTLIARIEANDPAGFERTAADIKMIALGRNWQSQNIADYVINYATYGITDKNSVPSDNYCLSMSCIVEYNNIQRWKVNDYPACYPSNMAYPPTEEEKKAESKAAMKSYETMFKDLMTIAGIVIDLALLL
jgi:hypothetical protein